MKLTGINTRFNRSASLIRYAMDKTKPGKKRLRALNLSKKIDLGADKIKISGQYVKNY